MTARDAFAAIATVLGRYTFRAADERSLQLQVQAMLEHEGIRVTSEVPSAAGRYDLLAELGDTAAPIRLVLELKLAASAPAVERQAQRYALEAGVDAVVVVTSSNRLAHELRQPGTTELGGKPFGVIALRAF